MKKLLFVVNGHSGKGQIKNKLLDIIDLMIKEGYHVQVHTTQEREDATNVVREQAKYYDLVVCSGGDGTLDEAVTGMMQSEVRTPLGYICQFSGDSKRYDTGSKDCSIGSAVFM